MRRPLTLTILAVLLLVHGVLSLVVKLFVAFHGETRRATAEAFASVNESAPLPIPFEVHLAHAVVASFVVVACGLGILRGARWARWLLIAWMPTASFLEAATRGLGLRFAVGLVPLALVLWVLLRRPAAEWFASERRRR